MQRPRITKKARVNAVVTNLRRRRLRRKPRVVVNPPRIRARARPKRQRRRNGGGPLGLNKKQLGTNLLMGLGTAIGGPMMQIFRPVVEAGVDFLGTYSTGASDNGLGTAGLPGQVIVTFTVAPRALANTRLNKVSELYQRYIFNRVTIRYMPAINVTQNGQLIGYFDTDPEDVPPLQTGLTNINYANAHGGKLFQISEPCTFEMPVIKDRTYYTDYDETAQYDEERFKIQAVFRVLQVTVLPASQALGSFAVDYNCEFELPQVTSNDPVADSASFYGFQTATILNQTNFAAKLSARFFNTCLNGGSVGINAQMTNYSSAQGSLWLQCQAQLASTGITFSSAEGVGPVYWQPGYYYSIIFTVDLSVGTMSFVGGSSNNMFPASPSLTFGGVTHWTSSAVASGDAFLIANFQISSTSPGAIQFDPQVNTLSTAVLNDFSCMVISSPVSYSSNHKHSKFVQKIMDIEAKLLDLQLGYNHALLNSPVAPVELGNITSYNTPSSLSLPDTDEDFEGVYLPTTAKFNISKKRKS